MRVRKQARPGSKLAALDIALPMQNVGIRLEDEVGPTVLIKQIVLGLERAGHRVDLMMLRNRLVQRIIDIQNPDIFSEVPTGPAESKPFLWFESGVRRVQRELGVPYFAFFDTYRFYQACLRALPGYSICHEYGGLLSPGTALACKKLGIPYVLTVDADLLLEAATLGKPLRGLHARVAAKEAKFTYRTARKLICVSRQAREHFVEVWGVDEDKIVVIPNGVDIELFGQLHDSGSLRLELGLGDAPVVGFVGGFQPWHGLDRLVQSYACIRREIPNARLLLVGDGPCRKEVEDQLKELGLQGGVTITGLIPQVQVPRFLSVMDVAVAPYPYLQKDLWFSPLKLYEYMAAGKAVVASNYGQIAEVFQDGVNGRLVRPGDTAGLARAIIELLNEPDLRRRLGQAARQQAVQQHSWDRYVERLEEVYWSILQ